MQIFASLHICEVTDIYKVDGADPSLLAEGIYSCGGKYLNLSMRQANCVAKEECTGLLFESKGLCLSWCGF